MRNKEMYIHMLEDQFLSKLERERDNLLKSFKRNSRSFKFISDRYFSTTISEFNFYCQEIDEKINTQLKAYAGIIGQLNKLENMPVSDDAQYRVYSIAMSLVSPAVNFGYCEEACELLKIIKNPNINEKFCSADVSNTILKVIDAYGKRSIIESGADFKESVDQIIADVVAGEYGEDTKTSLSIKDMEKAYREASVTIGDTVFFIDGSHEMIKDDRDKQ